MRLILSLILLSQVLFAQETIQSARNVDDQKYCFIQETTCSDTATLLDLNAARMQVSCNNLTGFYTITIDQLIYNDVSCKWEYEISSPIDIWGVISLYEQNIPIDVSIKLAVVNMFKIKYKLTKPYEIEYIYDLQFENLLSQTAFFSLSTSRIGIPVGVYYGRIRADEGATEINYNNWLQKNAIYQGMNNPPGYSSMEYFQVQGQEGINTFQRGWAWMSCNSNGCSIQVGFQYPVPPDYFIIPFNEIDMFWIEHSFEGSVGDKFNALEKFTVNN